MKFLCTGVNRETGARMTLEFEAVSKAAAERKATQSGMEVLHAHEVHAADQIAGERAPSHRGEHPSGTGRRGKLLLLVGLLVLLALAAAYFWPRLISFLHR
jgi:hypothetical protein